MRSNYILKLLEENERLDGRKLDEFRDIKVKAGIIERAEGSARVKMGKTDVIVGIKLDFGEPYPDTPNMGILRVDAEFTPISCEEFEPGPPGEDATELARVVDRGIRESECIDLEKLCVKKGEKVWMICVDIYPINHDGNLVDASALAAIAALLNTRLLKLDKDGNLIRDESSGKLPMLHKPITISVGKISDKSILDTTKEEEKLLGCKLSISIREDGKVCAMQKSAGSAGLTEEEVSEMIDLAVKKTKEIRKLV